MTAFSVSCLVLSDGFVILFNLVYISSFERRPQISRPSVWRVNQLE